MPIRTVLTERLGLAHPIIQAPLAGGGDTPALVAAVSEAGGLGSIGAAYLTPEQIAAACAAVRGTTRRPFGINLFAPQSPPLDVEASSAVSRVAPFFAQLGLAPPTAPLLPVSGFDAQLAAAIDGGASLFSFTLGMLPAAAFAAIKAKGLVLAGTATTVDEAVALERAGVDVVVAQGSEAGGHRGTFDNAEADSSLIGTLALGAGAAQLGTAFLTCDEAGVPDAYKQAILDAHEDETRVTRAFSGRAARGIVNRFMREIDAAGDVLPFPLQNSLTRPLRTAAAKQGRAEFLSLWAGQGVRMARRQTAADLVAALVKETDEAITRLSRLREGRL